MAMSDPISDVLTRIRNAQNAKHDEVTILQSKIVEKILLILKNEGFIGNFETKIDNKRKFAKVELKYYEGEPVIRNIERVSKPGKRIYFSSQQIQPTKNNIGISIFSTPKGVITGKTARNLNVGGEYICKVW